ncbi:alpha-galactosidase [Terriglobus aquaticus]|uniref:Enterotoxin n=1 Tax=Terriglobus aquaticus TaxID=940139 RepID=A0ABW9KQS4_9BACT|nr:enterotoxin [Terriglobus aquaticus]
MVGSRFVLHSFRAGVAFGSTLLFGSVHSAAAQGLPRDLAVRAGDLSVEATLRDGHVTGLIARDSQSGEQVRMPEAFSLRMQDGTVLTASALAATPGRAVEDPHQAFRPRGENSDEHTACVAFDAPASALKLNWCLVARAGTHYVRELLRLEATTRDVPLGEVSLLQWNGANAKVDGVVKGSPIVTPSMYFGFEHPLSSSTVSGGAARASLQRTLPLRAGQSITYSAVIGTAAPGQMRRDFLAYLEQERPRRYQPFLHYNTWYDLGYTNRFDEAGVLDRIQAFGEELTVKRHVQMDSFLLDDGWDDTSNLWNFVKGFPDGLAASSKAAGKYGFGIGMWLSPWGGYANEKKERVDYGEKHGYEILNGGYALSGPKYFARFERTCQQLIAKYNVNQFKFDGTGNADRVFPGSAFDSDFDAAIHLIEDLRRQKQDVFINLTTGTTASPFWVFYADSIWRGGEDHDFGGVGSSRQRWITYRDSQTFANIVQKGPLFPINSLMLHGIIYAKQAEKLADDPGNDFADEVHSYFGSGTQTQEMYITPSLLTPANWDTLATAARWSREHRDTLQDVHWLGGDPARLQVYGWAAWSPQLGIVTLRNPSDKPQTFTLEAAKAFELTRGAPERYQLRSVWGGSEHAFASSTLNASSPMQVTLAPFQVVTVEATPVR